jgi:hypothetical protein
MCNFYNIPSCYLYPFFYKIDQFYLVDELGLYSKEEDKELESRIKEAYPNENINPYAI